MNTTWRPSGVGPTRTFPLVWWAIERKLPTRITGAAVVATIVIVAAIAFAPWRLLIDTEVRDADPFAAAADTGSATTAPPTSTSEVEPPASRPSTTAPVAAPPSTAAPLPIRVGSFRSIAHQTSGDVRVGPTPDGRQVVRLEGLATDNGPDVRVFLSPHPPEGDDSIYGTDELELGPLKGNVGDQTYEVPAGVDLSRYQSVVLWCERFSVGFGVAGLAPA